MRSEVILQRQFRLAQSLMNSRDPTVARAARRALGSVAIVTKAVREDGRVRPIVTALLRAALILDALQTRERRLADRRRARKLRAVAVSPMRKHSDEEISVAMQQTGGNVRAAAATLGVAPSTVSRRSRSLRTVTERNNSACTYR